MERKNEKRWVLHFVVLVSLSALLGSLFLTGAPTRPTPSEALVVGANQNDNLHSVTSTQKINSFEGCGTTNLEEQNAPQNKLALDRNHPEVIKVTEIKDRHLDLMKNPNVMAMGVGLDQNQDLAVVVYSKDADIEIPKFMEGIPVVVRESDQIRAGRKQGNGKPPYQAKRPIPIQAGETGYAERYERPVPIGISTGHPSITAGTIGCRVTDGTNVFALSNNHVYADENSASLGDPVIQPGSFDGGSSPSDNMGTLFDYQPIQFGGNPNKPKNEIDAAIALSSTGDLGNSTPAVGGYGTPSSTTVAAALGMGVRKVGRTTGDTTGTVDAINVTVRVSYSAGPANYKNQIVIVPGTFSAGGDSGSLIVTDNASNNPVGLLYAGSSSHTIANDIDIVLSRFGVTVDDSDALPGNATPVVAVTSPADGSTHDSGAGISFSGSASDTEDGDLTGSLTWTSSIDGSIGSGGSFVATLSDGVHTITASAIDSGGATGSDSISITVGTPTTATTVSISSISYATEGGKSQDRHLKVTVSLVDDLGNAVSSASVSIQIDNTSTGAGASGSGTTGFDGSVTFTWKNAPAGNYVSTATSVTASGLTWDGVTPANGFTK